MQFSSETGFHYLPWGAFPQSRPASMSLKNDDQRSILVSSDLIILLLIVWFLGAFLVVRIWAVIYLKEASALFPPNHLVWADDQIWEDSCVVSVFSHFRVMEGAVLLWNLNAAKQSGVLSRSSVKIDLKTPRLDTHTVLNNLPVSKNITQVIMHPRFSIICLVPFVF